MNIDGPLSLLQLNQLVRDSIELNMPETYWVLAEISEIHQRGHCYLELIQKEEGGNRIEAKARAIIWSNVYAMLKPYFERETGQILQAGLKVLMEVKASFHEVFGFSLNVVDIDPSYTLGDMARKRKEILQRLEAEGILDLNKQIAFPELPQRIAVVSSATAAGYGDFCHQLQNNEYGFAFAITLFEAYMQGDRAEGSIIHALDAINADAEAYDVVVIIRGGGGTADLSCFDSYDLAAACAQFPLPIITGIGHERDDTILDVVAHARVKTPTAAAELLIDTMLEAATRVNSLAEELRARVQSLVDHEKERVALLAAKVPALATSKLADGRMHLQQLWQQLSALSKERLMAQRHFLQLTEQKLKDVAPENLLARGYSITYADGRVLKNPAAVQVGAQITTCLQEGRITSVVSQKDVTEPL